MKSHHPSFCADCLLWLDWNLELLVFVEGGKLEIHLQKVQEPTTNSTHVCIVSRTAIFSVIMRGSLGDDTKNGCKRDQFIYGTGQK